MNPSHTAKNIVQALEAGIENTTELLAVHDRDLGRTTPRNKRYAEELEEQLNHMNQQLSVAKELADPDPKPPLMVELDNCNRITTQEARQAILQARFIIEAVGTHAQSNGPRLKMSKEWMKEYFPDV